MKPIADIDQEAYERARRATREDRVLHVAFLRPDATPTLSAHDRRQARALMRQSDDAIRQVRADRARMLADLNRAKEARR